jgi:hypothetical protein
MIYSNRFALAFCAILITPGACLIATVAGCTWPVVSHIGRFFLGV